MLDMGFIHDVKKIIARVPAKRQTIFFSATMPAEISTLANTILTNPKRVEVTPVASTANTIQQKLYFIDKGNKRKLLRDLLEDKSIATALVFTRTKHGADRVAKDLNQSGIKSEAIHGNKSQNARQRALSNFKAQITRVLVATDIAARGIDIDELSHVINFELPNVPETYVHRIGRTGRAGASGISISFCDEEEKEYLRDIQKLIGKTVPVVADHAYPLQEGFRNPRVSPPLRQPQHNNRRNGNNSSSQRRSSGPSRSNNGAPNSTSSRSNGNSTRSNGNSSRSNGNSARPNSNSARPNRTGGRSSGGNSSAGNAGRWGSEDRDRNY
jgi:ATP-dependent RNA helicase RhlE